MVFGGAGRSYLRRGVTSGIGGTGTLLQIGAVLISKREDQDVPRFALQSVSSKVLPNGLSNAQLNGCAGSSNANVEAYSSLSSAS